MLGEGQYKLSRNGKSDGKVYLQENFVWFPDTENVVRDTIRASREPRPDQDFTERGVAIEKAGAIVGSSAEPLKVENPMKVEMDEFETSISHEMTDVDDSKLRLGESSAEDGAPEQPENIAIANELPMKFEDTESSLPKISEGEILEEPRVEGGQLLRQCPPKQAQTWTFRTLLSIFGLGERPLGKDKTRVRWGCVCGCNMYDDFTELRSGAAAELEKWLNDSMRSHAVSGPSSPPQNAGPASAASPSALNPEYQQTEESDISLQPYASTTDTLPGSSGSAAITVDIHLEKCWLLLCGKLKRGPDSLLTQLDLSSTPSDKKLFEDLKTFYSSLRNTWTLRPFLRGVKTIRFVQVTPSNGTNNSKSS